MKRDRLEQYIAGHREAFEVAGPGDGPWEGVRARIRPVRRIGWKRAAWQGAAAVAIFMLSWLIHDTVNRPVIPDAGGTAAREMNGRMQELLEADAFYSSRIAETKEAIHRLSGNDENIMALLDMDLEELERAFEELKKDLKDDTGNQEVIEAMIQNYRIKLEILEEMLKQMERSAEPNENTTSYEL